MRSWRTRTHCEQADAELLQPRGSGGEDRFTIIVETSDEEVTKFFIAAQGHTPCWTPRPESIRLPGYLEGIDEG